MRSRRSRRRGGARRRSWGWQRWLPLLGTLLLLGMLGGYGWLRSWLRGEQFRGMLEHETGRALQVEAKFSPFEWDGLSVSTTQLAGAGEARVKVLDARGISLEIGLGKIRQQIVEIRNARINRLELEVDTRQQVKQAGALGGGRETSQAKAKGPGDKRRHWYDSFVPREADLSELVIDQAVVHAELDAGALSMEGSNWVVRPGGVRGTYVAEGRGGVVKLPWRRVPALLLDRARLRYDDAALFLTDANFKAYERGALDLTGEVTMGGRATYSFDGRLRDVAAAEVVPEDWKQRLQGQVESEFGITKGTHGPLVEGRVHLRNGVLTGLPILEVLRAYGDNYRFLRLPLSEARADFHWEDQTLTLHDIVIASEGLTRLEGKITVNPDEHLDGIFDLGLTPGTLARIPGAETKVFLPGRDGLLWTQVRVSGTRSNPKEDLTERLVQAAGERILEILPETGEKVLKFTRRVIDPGNLGRVLEGGQLLGEGTTLLHQGKALLDQGKELIRDGATDPMSAASEILDLGIDFFGRGRKALDVLKGKDTDGAADKAGKKTMEPRATGETKREGGKTEEP